MPTEIQWHTQWPDLNDQLTQKIQAQADAAVAHQLYPGIAAAALDIAAGLVRSYPHRRKIFYPKTLDPFLDLVAKHLIAEGLNVEAFTLNEVLMDQAALLDRVSAETLFVALPRDVPIVAWQWPVRELIKNLTTKRVVSLTLSYHEHRFRAQPDWCAADPFEINVKHCRSTLAVAGVGARVKFQPLITPQLCWSEPILEQALSDLQLSHVPPNPSCVEGVGVPAADVDSVTPPEGLVLPKWAHTMIFRSCDAAALVESLKLKGFHTETPSLSFWGANSTQFLKAYGWSDDQIRGCLVVPHADAMRPGWAEALKESLAEVYELQG